MTANKAKLTIELHKRGALFRIEGNDDAELDRGLARALAFANRNKNKLARFDTDTLVKENERKIKHDKEKDHLDYRFPDWFYNGKVERIDAVATVLYFIVNPLTSGQIAEIITRAGTPIPLKNISKMLTTKRKFLYSHVKRDKDTGGYTLSGSGREWYRKQVLSRMKQEIPVANKSKQSQT